MGGWGGGRLEPNFKLLNWLNLHHNLYRNKAEVKKVFETESFLGPCKVVIILQVPEISKEWSILQSVRGEFAE